MIISILKCLKHFKWLLVDQQHQRIKKVLDCSGRLSRLWTGKTSKPCQLEMFHSLGAEHLRYENTVSMSWFTGINALEQIREYTVDSSVESYIQDSHILDMHWKPVSIKADDQDRQTLQLAQVGWEHKINLNNQGLHTSSRQLVLLNILIIGFRWIGSGLVTSLCR